VEHGLSRIPVHNVQSLRIPGIWTRIRLTASYLPAILGTMERDDVGHLPSGNQMEAHAHRNPAVDRQHLVDDFVHRHVEVLMEELKWEVLTEVQGRLEAEFIKSYLEAQGIEVELFQESIGHHIYPVTVDGLGRVQIFVSKEQAKEARQLLEEYNQATE